MRTVTAQYMFLMRDEKEERKKQTNKQGKATQHTHMYKQAVIHTKLSNRLYPIQYISQHDTARQYRTCIMDSDMAFVLIRSLCIKHLILNNVYCTSWIPGLVSCSFYAIPISPLLICKIFNLLVPFLFLLLLTIAIIRMNVQTGI